MNSTTEKLKIQTDILIDLIRQKNININQVRSANPGKIELLQNKLKEFSNLRGQNFYFPFLSNGQGQGPFVELIDGSVKYDLINSIGVNLLGHSHPIYIQSCLEAACYDTVMTGHLLPTSPTMKLTETLVNSVSGSQLKHFWPSCSGSFANDVALKLIWQKSHPKKRIISFKNSFMGRSIAMQELSDENWCRELMPQNLQVDHVPHFNISDPENSLSQTIQALDALLTKNGNVYCAICIEIIQGEVGFNFGPKSFYKEIFNWAKRNGIYVWVDEVQTFGRTQKLFAFQSFELENEVDVVTIGKVSQVCGTLYTAELNPRPGLIGGTFTGSIAALIASEKIINHLVSSECYGPEGRIVWMEKQFLSRLQNLANGSCQNLIGYYGGTGTLISFEVFDSSEKMTNKFLLKLFENGVIAYSGGRTPSRVRLMPSLVMTETQIDEVFSIIEKTLLSM